RPARNTAGVSTSARSLRSGAPAASSARACSTASWRLISANPPWTAFSWPSISASPSPAPKALGGRSSGSRSQTGLPLLPSRRPWPTTTGFAAPAGPPICCRGCATILARTPTAASTSRAYITPAGARTAPRSASAEAQLADPSGAAVKNRLALAPSERNQPSARSPIPATEPPRALKFARSPSAERLYKSSMPRNGHESGWRARIRACRSGENSTKATLHRSGDAGRRARHVWLRPRGAERGRGGGQGRGRGRLPALRLRLCLWKPGRRRRRAGRDHPRRDQPRGALGHLETLERHARRKGRDRLVPEVARRSAPRRSRPLPGALAVSELPPARLRRDLAQPRREALHPRELRENLARDGGAGRAETRQAHRHVQHDHPQAEAGPPRRAHKTRSERNGASPPFPAA